jgi:hypothetical protein
MILILTTMRYYLMPVRMSIIKKNVEKRKPLHAIGRDVS